MDGSGLIGVFSLAVGGTLLSVLFFSALFSKRTPLLWIGIVFLGFVFVGLGLLLILQDARSIAKQNPS
jgi:hypothetical protein